MAARDVTKPPNLEWKVRRTQHTDGGGAGARTARRAMGSVECDNAGRGWRVSDVLSVGQRN